MTAPRAIHPGRTYLITRRCTQRQFLLRPDEESERIFLYCLAEAAQRFGLIVLAWVAMSNHYHVVVEDTFGLLPSFLAHLNKLLAKVFNARWRRAENLWASEQASVVWLLEPGDVLEKTVYSLANPVAAELVDRLVDWPGAISFAWLDGREVELERPRIFFREAGTMPERVPLRCGAPTGWRGGLDAWASAVRIALDAREAALRAERVAANRRIVGRKSVLRASPFDRPSSTAVRGGLRPRVACSNLGRRRAALEEMRNFRRRYADALQRTRAGAEKALFPAGTYKLVWDGLVRAEPAPPALTTFCSWALPP